MPISSSTHGSQLARIRADITGGLSAGIVTLPKAMAYGSIVFLPLGEEYIPLGIMAGLMSLAFGNLISFRNSSPILINSTFSLASMMLASALLLIIDKVQFLPEPQRLPIAITLLFLVMFCCGVFQVIGGMIRLGGLSKYIPRPVIAGLGNGVALLILLAQLPVLLTGTSGVDMSELLNSWNPLNFTVGAFTIAGVIYGPRITRRMPPVFIGMAMGCVVFSCAAWLSGELPGPMLGYIPSGIPLPEYGQQILAIDSDLLAQCLFLLPYILGIAAILSLWSLLFMASSDNMLGRRSDGNDELISQGLSNMLVSLFGGVAVAGNSNTIVNFSNGGRGHLSKLMCGVFALSVVVFLGPLIGKLPLVVLAAILIVFSVQAVDKWSVDYARRLLGRTTTGLSDFLIMLGVMSILLGIGVLEAVAAGICISLILFIRRMGKEILRADNSASNIRSCVIRPPEERELLASHGYKIRVIEIEGALFFGTADRVAERVYSLATEGVEFIILDMRRITDVDSTGADLLLRLRDFCLQNKQQFLLSGIDTRESDNAFLKSIGALDVFTEQAHFVYLNDALTVAEDRLLDSLLSDTRYQQELGFWQLDILSNFSTGELESIRGHFEKLIFEVGDTVFNEGESAESIYLLANGRVSIKLQAADGNEKTLASLCPGFAFGEMALLVDRKRYGTAYVEQAATCYRLDQQQLQKLQQHNPALAFHLLSEMARDLSDRIQQTSATSTTIL